MAYFITINDWNKISKYPLKIQCDIMLKSLVIFFSIFSYKKNQK